ncbi:BamA/OMP85 family outer membrane protein [Vampirovibrio chlorellavorus]|uniref:BamA/OMP85 family outer membrane protein n=1 Tax=Vampirovibrio chlorellavorus TaxID=758823 RepID=UPI0026F15260|nr:BamA/TamA family outer membrane protein [Vampirovibrio chlorellavorus]
MLADIFQSFNFSDHNHEVYVLKSRLLHIHQPPLMLALLALSIGVSTSVSQTWAEDALAPAGDVTSSEESTPTPLSEFAPDEVRAARDQRYDQGLTVNKISIEGNRLVQSDKIKDSMVMRPGSLYSKNTLKDDLRRIYDMGYFTEKIKAVPVSTSEGIVLRIVVQENAPVTGVHIEGNSIVEDSELQAIFAKQTGMPQNIGQLNESIEKVEKLYADKGYVLARVSNIEDDPDGVINLKINEGTIDKVQFVGNRKTKDFVIKRLMTTKVGDVYNEKALADDLKRIFGTQAFSDVRRVITASPDNPDKYNLTVEVDEKRTGSISVGGGVDTNTGLFGSLGYSDPNFLGRGQNVNSIFAVGSGIIGRDRNTQASARTYQFDVGWSDPSFMNTANSLSANLYGRDFSSFNIPLGIERRIGTEVAWGAPLMKYKNTSVGLSLRGENVRIRDFANNNDLREFGISSSERKDQLKGGTFVSLSPTLAFDTRNNRFNPTSGWLNTVSLTGAYGLSNNSYGLVSANLRKYIKIREGITLALNAQGGNSLLGDIPEFNMFRMGGAYSVRGFQEGGLGIGNGYLLSTAELRAKVPMIGKMKNIPVLNSLSLATFLDAGTVLGESNFNNVFNRTGRGMSTGLGIRLNMPGVGPIRIDYAIPIAGGSKYNRPWNFGVGEKF